MRNLSLSSVTSSTIWDISKGEILSGSLFDIDNKSVLSVSEILDSDATQVLFRIWKFDGESVSKLVARTQSPAASFATPDSSQSQLVEAKFLPENRMLCLVSAAGDIMTGLLDDDSADVIELEIVGSIESGVKCAKWSPDDDLLVLVTGDDNLLQMTKEFDVISEAPLRKADPGEEQSVNVGWGSKQTQFHGSLGKTAAASSADQAATAAAGGSSPDDDSIPRISWRGDGAFFVVSSLDLHQPPPTSSEPYTKYRRVLRFYDRAGTHQSTSEATPGLEHPVAWRPSGGLIASAQRFGFPGGGQGNKGRHDIVFFERNGLRHGEFSLREELKETPDAKRRWGYRVRELAWNSDSTILAAWIERDEGDVVQLWTVGNYHWYLKQEIPAPETAEESAGRLTSLAWHPEEALRLITTAASQAYDFSFCWETCASSLPVPIDTATVAVVDGASLLVTPFRFQNVPPPMSSYKIERAAQHLAPPMHVSIAPNADALAILYKDATVEIWSLGTGMTFQAAVSDPKQLWSGEIPGSFSSVRQILAWVDEEAPEEWFVALLGHPREGKHDVVVVAAVRGGVVTDDYETSLPAIGRGQMIFLDGGKLAWEGFDGQILRVDFENELATPMVTLPGYCPQIVSIRTGHDDWTFCALSSSGKLYVVGSTSDAALTLATNCTSFTFGSGFVIYTTSAHYGHFAPLSTLVALIETGVDGALPQWEQRRVERGSRIVTVVPSAMSLVLQMPRGNLETINPRPLVLAIIKRDVDVGDYRKALLACRKHRIDLNVLVDHDPNGFTERIASFVDQVHEVDYINLFLSGIGQSAQSPERIANICDSIRLELEKKDLKKYVNSILTAHVVKTPSDTEAALGLLLQLRKTDPTLVEEAVKYIIFLVDADKLFDTALSMYDFSLVLLVAQHSPKKDPREYLPFLRDLRDSGDAHGSGYQRYKIDDYLKRYEKALHGLHEAGAPKFHEATAYMEKHRLYQEALRIWKTESEQKEEILKLYGEHLFERREFRQAALAFVQAKKPQKAMLAFEKAHLWQELFAVVMKEGLSFDELAVIGQRVGEELASRKRYLEAGRVLLEYSKNVDEAVAAFAQGGEFAEADRICALQSRLDLIETILHPEAFEIRAQIGEDVQETVDQLKKQSGRLKELRERKATDPDAFYNLDSDRTNPQNVDVMTDAGGSTVAGTTFTRYTVAPSATSKKSKGSSKTRRKMARNKGKKGTIEEEEYILLSIAKMPVKLEAIQVRASKVLPFLLLYTPEHREQGSALQNEVKDLEVLIKQVIEKAWVEKDEEEEMEPAPGTLKIPATTLPRKPELSGTGIEWMVNLL